MHKQVTTRTLIATGIFIGLIATGVAIIRHTPGIADADQVPPNQASITIVEAHSLTPGPVTSERLVKNRGTCAASVASYHSDGLKEYTLVARPKAQPPKAGYPVIIFAHGYTNPASYQTDNQQYSEMVTWYCQHNYLVFKPDYRGHGISDGRADNGLYSPADTYDVLNLVASLGSYPNADASRVALIGHSMGGGIVLRAAVADHNLPIKAIITIAGAVTSLPDMTYHWSGHIPPDVASKRLQAIRAEGPPSQNPSYWHDGSAINFVKNLNAPVQIHHGLADSSVPVSFATTLDSTLTLAHKSHQLYTYPGTGHIFSSAPALPLFLSRSTSFLDTYMK
jgi:dipeptidyl aminopeptidase/acylaminoacyl peptidase